MGIEPGYPITGTGGGGAQPPDLRSRRGCTRRRPGQGVPLSVLWRTLGWADQQRQRNAAGRTRTRPQRSLDAAPGQSLQAGPDGWLRHRSGRGRSRRPHTRPQSALSRLRLAGRDYPVGAARSLRYRSIEHQLLIGTECERYALSEFMLRSNNLRTVDLYNPVYGAPRPAFNPARTVDRNELVHSRALNLQDQIRFTDKLFGVIGARYDHYEERLDNEVAGRRAEQTHEKVTPRVGVLYQLVPQVGLFANASQSFKPNNGADVSGATFDPEEGVGYEAGVKLDLFDGRLGLTAAAFHLTKENVLTSDPANDGFQIAAGEVRSRGIDLQLAGQLTDAIRVIGGYAYVDAEVTRDNTLASGSRLLNVPRHSGSLLTTYEFLDGDLSGLSLGGAVNYVGNRAGQADSDFELPSYTTVDLLARYKATQKLTLGVNLNNAFDRTYYERSYSNVWIMPGEPRNLSVSLSVEL
ncbi:TonB-dependent siderophore receptor [Stutzerimonas kunmingensis]|uniref:TonB-dependent siderophore receptor n=1 Tax=Stutzerimonas kunmingensis TaxID=1211807 RepID=UPI0037D7FAF1